MSISLQLQRSVAGGVRKDERANGESAGMGWRRQFQSLPQPRRVDC